MHDCLTRADVKAQRVTGKKITCAICGAISSMSFKQCGAIFPTLNVFWDSFLSLGDGERSWLKELQ